MATCVAREERYEIKTRIILVRALIALMALIILALAAAGTLVFFSYAELSYLYRHSAIEGLKTPDMFGKENITMRPECESYPKGTEKIKFIVSNPAGLAFTADYYYMITKESYIFKVWPTRLGVDLRGDRDLRPHAFSSQASENGEPITLEYTLDLDEWSFKPTRGTYTYSVLIRVTIDGVEHISSLSCDFTIE